MRSILLLCGLLLVGCDSFREELPGLFATASSDAALVNDKRLSNTGSRQATALDPTRALTTSRAPRNRQAQLARQLEAKLKPPALPATTKEQDCSGVTSLPVDGGDASGIVLVDVDARSQTKNLISRRVSERLESGELTLLATVLESSSSDRSSSVRHDVPTAAVTLTDDDLGRIQKQRYLGVFYITEYQGPSLILRVGKIRREWYEGQLRAKFVLFDTDPQRVVCASDLYVKNDAKSAPIRTRLQSETRGRLERELGDALRLAAERNLGHVAGQLQWPDSGMAKRHD